MIDELLAETTDSGALRLTLNRPHALNALNGPLKSALLAAIHEVDERTPAVVLRGAGTAFCAGQDVKTAADEPTPGLLIQLQEITRALRACPAPVIAAVHGHAVGGGAELALACDLVIADETAQFQFPETAIGVTVTGGMSSILPSIVGPLRAKQILFLGDVVSAHDAAALGMVNRVVAPGELDAAVAQALERLGDRSAPAIRRAKRLFNDSSAAAVAASLEREVDIARSAMRHDLGAR
ncbi:MAG TPA: enoyl-CoA hydratase/isomerase family protein [Conexibacter sp.]|nr:enoyl-CoA hydratase/isomerase family protein [Conexibacter sp.]